jgi:hypothetical protein
LSNSANTSRAIRKLSTPPDLARQLLAPRYGAPAVFGNQSLKRLVEIVGVLERVCDAGIAEHGFKNFQPLS